MSTTNSENTSNLIPPPPPPGLSITLGSNTSMHHVSYLRNTTFLPETTEETIEQNKDPSEPIDKTKKIHAKHLVGLLQPGSYFGTDNKNIIACNVSLSYLKIIAESFKFESELENIKKEYITKSEYTEKYRSLVLLYIDSSEYIKSGFLRKTQKILNQYVNDKCPSCIHTNTINFALCEKDIRDITWTVLFKESTYELVAQLEKTSTNIDRLGTVLGKIKALSSTVHPNSNSNSSPTHYEFISDSIKSNASRIVEYCDNIYSQLEKLSVVFGGHDGEFHVASILYPGINWKSVGEKLLSIYDLKKSKSTNKLEIYFQISEIFGYIGSIMKLMESFVENIIRYLDLGLIKDSNAIAENYQEIAFDIKRNVSGIAGMKKYLLSNDERLIGVSMNKISTVYSNVYTLAKKVANITPLLSENQSYYEEMDYRIMIPYIEAYLSAKVGIFGSVDSVILFKASHSSKKATILDIKALIDNLPIDKKHKTHLLNFDLYLL